MVTARMKRAAQELEQTLVMEIVEEEQRPQGSRGRYSQDPSVGALVSKVLSTVDTNKCVKARVAEADG